MLRRLSIMTGALALVVGGAACSSDEPGTATDATADLAREQDPRVQAENEVQPEPEAFAFTQEVRITDTAVVPATGVAIVGNEVVFRNETTAPLTIDFLNGPIDETDTRTTGEIAPGGEFRFTPARVYSHTFAVVGRPELRGQLQVDPGEDFDDGGAGDPGTEPAG
jgi:hypothetical protein